MLEVRIPSPVQAPPLEPITPIKPSEAYRLGRLTYPNRLDRNGETSYGDSVDRCACAIGVIAIGYGWDPDDGLLFPGGFLAGRIGYALTAEIESRFEGYDDWHDNAQTDDQIVAWLQSKGL